jgi:hypothetical protein
LRKGLRNNRRFFIVTLALSRLQAGGVYIMDNVVNFIRRAFANGTMVTAVGSYNGKAGKWSAGEHTGPLHVV